jgi:hypothetical protein
MAAAHVGAFVVQQDDLFVANRALVIDFAAQRRLPGMYVFSFYPRSGGLMSYGANAEDLYRRAAGYVDRILKGAKPSELPVERPIEFELVINLKIARALGLTIPPSLLLRADQVINEAKERGFSASASQDASGSGRGHRDGFHVADGNSDRRSVHWPRLRVGGRDPSGSPPRWQEPTREDSTSGTSRDRTGHDLAGP